MHFYTYADLASDIVFCNVTCLPGDTLVDTNQRAGGTLSKIELEVRENSLSLTLYFANFYSACSSGKHMGSYFLPIKRNVPLLVAIATCRLQGRMYGVALAPNPVA